METAQPNLLFVVPELKSNHLVVEVSSMMELANQLRIQESIIVSDQTKRIYQDICSYFSATGRPTSLIRKRHLIQYLNQNSAKFAFNQIRAELIFFTQEEQRILINLIKNISSGPGQGDLMIFLNPST